MAFKSEPREPSYCDPEMVAETLGLPDPNDPMGILRFSDMSAPTYSFVKRLILSNEDLIDGRLQRSWRVNRVRNHIATINDYYADRNGMRSSYYSRGGNYIQLHRWMLPIDPTQGDRIEVRTRGNQWRDITEEAGDLPDMQGPINGPLWWTDTESGRLFIRTRLFQTMDNAVRISYRWGTEEDPPEGISRLCSLMTARDIIASNVYDIKVGTGGDVAGVKDQLLRWYDQRIGELFSTYQRAGSVHSLLQ